MRDQRGEAGRGQAHARAPWLQAGAQVVRCGALCRACSMWVRLSALRAHVPSLHTFADVPIRFDHQIAQRVPRGERGLCAVP